MSSEKCPYCGAPENDICTQKYVSRFSEDYVKLGALNKYSREIEPIMYFCSECNNRWVIDIKGNSYSVEDSMPVPQKHASKNSNENHSIVEHRLPLNLRYFWNQKTESNCMKRKSPTTDSEHEAAIKKLSEGSNFSRAISVTKREVVFCEGKYFISALSKDSPVCHEIKSAVIERADSEFNFRGKLCSYVRRSKNPSMLEQRISNFFKSGGSDIVHMVEFIRHKMPEDAKNIDNIREIILQNPITS